MTDFVWVEKYRPKKIEDCILPDTIKNQFKLYPELLIAMKKVFLLNLKKI